MDSRYVMVARTRFRETPTRLAMATFIAATAFWLMPSIWPAVWFLAVALGQIVDWLSFRSFLRPNATDPGRTARLIACLSIAVNCAVYSSITLPLWLQGGRTGLVFASILVAGALLHVSLHLHHSRAILLSAVIPHTAYFLGLPTLIAIVNRDPRDMLVVVGCGLYMTHLVVAVRQSSLTTNALRNANAVAQRERQRAETANAAKSDFLAVVSHEIRTPMNAVLTAAHLLRQGRLNKAQSEQVDMLKDAGEVLIGLLNDVLDFSKIEAGKMELESADLDLVEKLNGTHRLWRIKAEEKGVALRLEIEPGMPGRARTDPLRFQQILFNLLSNAIKFTSAGEVAVIARWDADRSRLEVMVRDTGVGVAPEVLPHIFDGFRQADAGIARRFGGTGLGLSISRRLAQMMGGDLTAESTPGQGSTFRLDLPMTVSEVVEDSATSDETALSPGLSVLAVDDHAVNRRILALLLEPMGCVLTFAENGEEAVMAAQTQIFDVILMDMQMPIMDGVAATAAIRADGANRDTPVIALTANAMDDHRAAWQGLGVSAYLTKPIDPAVLAAALAQAVRADPASPLPLAI